MQDNIIFCIQHFYKKLVHAINFIAHILPVLHAAEQSVDVLMPSAMPLMLGVSMLGVVVEVITSSPGPVVLSVVLSVVMLHMCTVHVVREVPVPTSSIIVTMAILFWTVLCSKLDCQLFISFHFIV